MEKLISLNCLAYLGNKCHLDGYYIILFSGTECTVRMHRVAFFIVAQVTKIHVSPSPIANGIDE